MLLGGLLAGCAAVPSPPGRSAIAKIERVDGTTDRITLTAQAVKRIGIQTTVVRTAADGSVIPYSALIYDTKGATFAYTNPESLVFVRHAVRVVTVRGDQVVIADGPPAGVAVVTVGASQLLGIELGIGS